MEEVRVNVRSRRGQLEQAGLRGPPPSFVPPLGPPRVYLTTIPHTQPLSSRTFSSSLGLGDLQEQAGVASRRG